MRHLLLPTCLAALCFWGAPTARAEDCDVLCRLAGYLSTDHMAAAPAEAEPPHGSIVKARHKAAAPPRKVAVKTAPAKPTAPAAPKVEAAPPAIADARPATSPHAGRSVAAATPERPTQHRQARPVRQAVAALSAQDDPAEAPAPATAPKAGRPSRAPRIPQPSFAVAPLIPGSAPTVPAGFQQVGSLAIR